MLANQTLVAQDGKEVFLFPCEAMYLTEARQPPEHDVLALDFLPRTITGNVIVGMRCYAPFTGTVVYTGNDHNLILQSNDEVHFADGTTGYARVLVAHSWVAPTMGTTYRQGQEFYITGNYGQSFGEHLHMEVAKVDNVSEPLWNSGGIGLYKGQHMWNCMFVNDTSLLRTGDFNWLIWERPIPTPPTFIKKRFPWVLYAKKLREKR